MNNTLISLVLGMILILGVGGVVLMQKNAAVVPMDTSDAGAINAVAPSGDSPVAESSDDDDASDDDDSNTAATSAVPAPTTPTGASGYTSAQVATHATRTSCWSSINGSVYDLTSWIPKHPGGEQAILKLCGVDGSASFNRQHGGAAKQAAILVGFKIGTVQ